LTRPAKRSLPFAAALLLFLLSGAGALVIETTWLRWLRGLLGATAPAASATLVAFFLGQAAGAAAGARLAPRARRPLALYGVLELAAAAWALAVPTLLGAFESGLHGSYDAVRSQPALLVSLRFAAALAATLPASLAFGATLPALAAACLESPAALAGRGAALYGVNVAGAALGTALASFWLPDAFGVRGGHAVGVAALALAGGSALLLSGRFAAGAAAEPARAAPRAPAPEPVPAAALVALAALSGFGCFAAEVLFVQAFGLVLDQSVYAFGAVMVVVLGALALAALAVAGLGRRPGAPPAAILGAGLAAAALALAGFPALFFAATGGLEFLASERPWPGYVFAALGVAATTAGPALLAAGLVFPTVLAAAGDCVAGGAASARLGRLAAANTAGALLGALAAPWLLLPALGLWPAFGVLGALYGAAALAVSRLGPRRRALLPVLLAGGAASLLAFANPWRVPLLRLAPNERLVAVESTPAGVVAVVDRAGDLLIQTDNHYALGGSSQAVHEERQAHLALVLRPGARRMAWIGSATGISPGAALVRPLEALALVELVPGVARAARRHFAPWNRGVYEDPRSDVVLDDGRNFLRATAQRFDAIVADLFVPWQAGAASLYTREHFAAARARLEPGGLFCQWLPLYQLGEAEIQILLATFLDVFPQAALFRGDFYGRFPIVALAGWAGEPPRADAVSAAAAELAAAGVTDRWVSHPVGVWSLYVGPLGPVASSLAASPRNLEDSPRLEFLAARSRGGGVLLEDAFVGVRFVSFARAVADGLAPRDPLFGPLGEARLRAAAGGHALQSADALYAAGRSEESGRALAAAAAFLPPELLAEAPPDPSAVTIWRADGAAGDGR
jgi:spermidine synthase